MGGGGVATNQTGIILIDIKILVIQDGNLSDLCSTGLNQVQKVTTLTWIANANCNNEIIGFEKSIQ